MADDLRLVLFDVDGTLVDSQADILGAMRVAFQGQDLPMPSRDAVLSIVGLSLPRAMQVLAPDQPEHHDRLVEGYKLAYMQARAAVGVADSSPLYPGIEALLHDLAGRDTVLLGIATGKSRRGLDSLLEGHGLTGRFLTQQVADHHPSKPHPSMVLTAMREMGVTAAQTVMIGDTSYDMEMARAAGAHAIGVAWGYHDRARLRAAHHIAETVQDIPTLLETVWRTTG